MNVRFLASPLIERSGTVSEFPGTDMAAVPHQPCTNLGQNKMANRKETAAATSNTAGQAASKLEAVPTELEAVRAG